MSVEVDELRETLLLSRERLERLRGALDAILPRLGRSPSEVAETLRLLGKLKPEELREAIKRYLSEEGDSPR